MGCRLSEDLIAAAVSFHGHWCPGLAIGIRAAEIARSEVGCAGDEDVVAVVETDMCGVDAIQYLTGCTFGKGNLIHIDHGKNVFTFHRRSDGKAVRVVTRSTAMGENHTALQELRRRSSSKTLTTDTEEQVNRLREQISQHIMESPLENLFDLQQPKIPAPQRARILESLACDGCGENVMETRCRLLKGRRLCIPCFEAALSSE